MRDSGQANVSGDTIRERIVMVPEFVIAVGIGFTIPAVVVWVWGWLDRRAATPAAKGGGRG